jgi:hypothetical protein
MLSIKTIETYGEIIGALASAIGCSEEIAPGYRVLLRDPANPALPRLSEAATGKRVSGRQPRPSHRAQARSSLDQTPAQTAPFGWQRLKARIVQLTPSSWSAPTALRRSVTPR